MLQLVEKALFALMVSVLLASCSGDDEDIDQEMSKDSAKKVVCEGSFDVFPLFEGSDDQQELEKCTHLNGRLSIFKVFPGFRLPNLVQINGTLDIYDADSEPHKALESLEDVTTLFLHSTELVPTARLLGLKKLGSLRFSHAPKGNEEADVQLFTKEYDLCGYGKKYLNCANAEIYETEDGVVCDKDFIVSETISDQLELRGLKMCNILNGFAQIRHGGENFQLPELKAVNGTLVITSGHFETNSAFPYLEQVETLVLEDFQHWENLNFPMLRTLSELILFERKDSQEADISTNNINKLLADYNLCASGDRFVSCGQEQTQISADANICKGDFLETWGLDGKRKKLEIMKKCTTIEGFAGLTGMPAGFTLDKLVKVDGTLALTFSLFDPYYAFENLEEVETLYVMGLRDLGALRFPKLRKVQKLTWGDVPRPPVKEVLENFAEQYNLCDFGDEYVLCEDHEIEQ